MASDHKYLLKGRLLSGFEALLNMELEEGEEELAIVDLSIALVGTITKCNDKVLFARSELLETKVRVVQSCAELSGGEVTVEIAVHGLEDASNRVRLGQEFGANVLNDLELLGHHHDKLRVRLQDGAKGRDEKLKRGTSLKSICPSLFVSASFIISKTSRSVTPTPKPKE